ncbi:MAG: hypothetical protein WCP01_16770 [Methylococcaceae bacterium]
MKASTFPRVGKLITRAKIHLIAISMNAVLWLALVPLVNAYA